MNILFVTFSDYENDGRTKDLLQVAKMFGKVQMLGMPSCKFKNLHINKSVLYMWFLCRVVYKAFLAGKVDCIFIDNYHAALPGMIIKLLWHPNTVIQDVRELYTYSNLPSMAGKFFIYCEKKLMQQADVVICANQYRSVICKALYNLKNLPIVYENMHWIRVKSHDKNVKDTIVISTDGLKLNRELEKFLLSKKEIDDSVKYYIVGAYNDKEYQYAKKIISEHDLKNIHILGKLSRQQLGDLISNCDIGIVKYNFDDLNNIFCASGKIYEFLMMGLPVVTTEHFELKKLCDTYGVGVSDNSFSDGINHVLGNYSKYIDNVASFQRFMMKRNVMLELYENIKNRIDR